MLEKYKYHLWLHFVVLLFGLTGIFGKLIEAPSFVLVWYRVAIAIAAIFIFFKLKKIPFLLDKKWLLRSLGVGVIVAVHWITFFESIKQSNVSVALICFSSTTLFTALIEPFIFKRKIKVYEILLGLVIIGGLSFIFTVELQYKLGILLSIFSAFLASLFTVINGVFVKQQDAKVISFYQLIGCLLLVSIYSLVVSGVSFAPYKLNLNDVVWVLILGVVCTAFAYIASVQVMKQLSPFTVTISVNLEPIYSILLAVAIWPQSETMSLSFYIGSAIVLMAILANAYLKNLETKSTLLLKKSN
ncbi:MAG: DMT family transporter [Vicingaceae bacterium]